MQVSDVKQVSNCYLLPVTCYLKMSIFKRKPKEYKSVSLSELTWQRFKKERQGMISLGYILLMVIIALLGYLITPEVEM